MRLFRHSIRFTIAAFAVVALAVPASAGTEPEGLTPGPSRQPTSHASQSAAWNVGTLTIPAIGVDESVLLGVDASVLDQGVGFWAGTSTPGTGGNVVLAGHRTTHGRPFNDLDKLRVGDVVSMTDSDGIDVIYRVSETMIVEPSDLWITYDRPKPTLTMFACHPKGSAEQRIVVVAELVSNQRML
jgi:sortase A